MQIVNKNINISEFKNKYLKRKDSSVCLEELLSSIEFDSKDIFIYLMTDLDEEKKKFELDDNIELKDIVGEEHFFSCYSYWEVIRYVERYVYESQKFEFLTYYFRPFFDNVIKVNDLLHHIKHLMFTVWYLRVEALVSVITVLNFVSHMSFESSFSMEDIALMIMNANKELKNKRGGVVL